MILLFEPKATWESSLAQLQTDPRFRHSSLPLSHQHRLFEEHVGQLRTKHLDNLHAFFHSKAPSLAAEFTALPITSLLSSLPATKLGFDVFKLEEEFNRWQRTRTTDARKAFDDMLHENSFIEFWGRLSKLDGEGVDGGVKRDDVGDEDEGEGGGGNVDMKKLAKSVDITEMERVLKVRTLPFLGLKSFIRFEPSRETSDILCLNTFPSKGNDGCGYVEQRQRGVMNLKVTQNRITCRDYLPRSCLYMWERTSLALDSNIIPIV